MKTTTALLLILAAGCSGGPLKELPVFEAPPPEPVEAAPAPAPVVEAGPPSLLGAWSSTALAGPGSATLRRVVMIFDADGSVKAAAFGDTTSSAFTGAYQEMDGAILVDVGGPSLRLWETELGRDTLILRDEDREIRFERLR